MNPLPSNSNTLKLVTRNGAFHVDQAFAFATLGLAYHDRQLDLVRSSDPSKLADADIVFGVGSRYDPQHRRFDPQQNNHPRRKDGIPFSAFGLIWQHLGLLAISSVCADAAVPAAAAIWRHIDVALVRSIDLDANGNPGCPRDPAAEMVNELNLLLDDDDASDDAFLRAAGFADMWLRRAIVTAASGARENDQLADLLPIPAHVRSPECRNRCTGGRLCRSMGNRAIRLTA